MSEWSDYDAESSGFTCEPGIGLTVTDDHPDVAMGYQWFSWDETCALHAWLTRKIAEANP
jgi:hypothetical protein